MTFDEIAWEFVDVFSELDHAEINEMLAKNVPYQNLEFFNEYTAEFAAGELIDGKLAKRLPNLMLIGYLLRVLEERLLPDDE